MKEWILVAAMMGVLLVTAMASDKTNDNDSWQDLRKERHAYFLEKVKPEIDASRNTLETSISAEDKNEINRLREDIVKQKLLESELRYELRNARIKGEKIDDALIAKLSTQHMEIENLYDRAKVVANKYRPQIDELLAGIELPRQNLNNSPRGRNYEQQGNRGQGQGRQGMQRNGNNPYGRSKGHGQGYGLRGGFDITSFLLWDPNRNYPF
ncbi:MAG: hypothetical protein HC819_01025 [Cyclobacteriaceae bacterium]|nr:hypothetical protein [Cyclobacteriaceae bacterium]